MRFMLKPCPFCGNEKPNLLNLGEDDWYVECGAPCTAQMVLVGSQARAVTNWNKRTATSPDKLREALVLAEDVLSRAPFSTTIWPNGIHPQTGIEQIRTALQLATY